MPQQRLDGIRSPERLYVSPSPESRIGDYPRAGPLLGAPERTTDLGNGRRFAWQWRDDVRFAGGRWYVWDGRRFALDETGQVARLAKETARSIVSEAQACGEDDAERKKLMKWSLASECASRQRAMLELAKSELPLTIGVNAFDTDPYLLNCENGTLDLRTGGRREHSKADLITKLANARFDSSASCALWQQFLRRIFDGNADVIAFVQRAIGYSLVGATTEQVLFFCYGLGANGKSTFLEVVKAVFGDYARTADFSTFAARRNNEGPRNDIARLRGARLVTAIEFGAGRALDEVIVKQLTGGDTVAARLLYRESEEFTPAFTPWIAGNHKPLVKGTDEAIWRRLRLIPFNVTIPEAERDPNLRARLLGEASGILAWAVKGCLNWQRDGLQPPPEVLTATRDYRSEMDAIEPFLEVHAVRDERASVKATELFTAYKQWAQGCGEEPISQRAFGLRLSEQGFAAQKRSGSIWRLGLRLRSEADELEPPW